MIQRAVHWNFPLISQLENCVQRKRCELAFFTLSLIHNLLIFSFFEVIWWKMRRMSVRLHFSVLKWMCFFEHWYYAAESKQLILTRSTPIKFFYKGNVKGLHTIFNTSMNFYKNILLTPIKMATNNPTRALKTSESICGIQ